MPPINVDVMFRDFQRYTGDGLPNAPAGHPLPIGDPTSGVYNPTKRDFRELGHASLDAAVQAQEAAEAATAAMLDVQGASFYAANLTALLANTSPSYPAGTVFATRAEGLSYEVVASGEHYTTAGGVKLAEAGPRFSTLARLQAAIARGLSVRPGVTVWADGVPYIGDAASNDPAPGIRRRLDGGYMRLLSLPFVDPTWLGMRETATGATNASALSNAIAEGKRVILPRGKYEMAPVSVTISAPQDVVIEGAGPNATVLQYDGTDGIKITIPDPGMQMQEDKVSIDISGIGFRVLGADIGNALHIDHTATGTGDAGTAVLRRIANCSFAGRNAASGWNTAIRLRNGNGWTVEDIWSRGAENQRAGSVITFEGDLSSYETYIGRVRAQNFHTALLITARNEGLVVRDCSLAAGIHGLKWWPGLESGEASQPLLICEGNHINVSGVCVDVDNVERALISGNSLFLDSASALGILLRRQAVTAGIGHHKVIGNDVIGLHSPSGSAGITLGAYCGQSVVANNGVANVSNAYVLLANCNQCVGSNNIASSIVGGSGLVNQGSNNSVSVTTF